MWLIYLPMLRTQYNGWCRLNVCLTNKYMEQKQRSKMRGTDKDKFGLCVRTLLPNWFLSNSVTLFKQHSQGKNEGDRSSTA